FRSNRGASISVWPGVRSRMNGTLISHPPGGGGSGSSVTNGGPARVKSSASNQPTPTITQQSFINLPEVRFGGALFMHHLQDAPFSGIDQVYRFTFASNHAARSFDCGNQRL